MSVYQVISEWSGKIFHFSKNVFVVPNIPEKKLNGAIKGMDNSVTPESVIMTYDSTLFGGADEGMMFTTDTMYHNDSKKWSISYVDMDHADCEVAVTTDKKGKEKRIEVVHIYLKTGSVKVFEHFYVNGELFADFINALINEVSITTKVETVNNIPLEEQSEDVKLNYLKIIANFMCSDDGKVDNMEMQEVYSLIERINLTTESRYIILEYMEKQKEPTIALVNKMIELVNEVTQANLIPSLLKDLINIQSRLKKESYLDNTFIMSLAAKLNVSHDTLKLLHDTIENDRKIFLDEIDDKGLADGFSSLIAGAASVGVPIAALYFSGSVIGLGATGITSGLAALGFGGILGFSSMATGVGVLLAVGYGVHKGVKVLTGSNELEARKKKEAMLLHVAKHQQNTINLIMMDIQYFIGKLGEAFTHLNALESDIALKNEKIQNLYSQLKILSSIARSTSVDQQYTETCALRTQLPRYLDINRLAAITAESTRKKYYDLILACYQTQQKSTTKSDGTVSTETKYILRTDLSKEQTEILHNLLEMLEYFSATSTLKGFFK